MTEVIAILCSDIHLSHARPSARAGDWYAAMEYGLGQLIDLQNEFGIPPVVFAGDLFDRWNSPPELINFAAASLPEDFYCIRGQHDLPNHNHDEIHRSAYYTLSGPQAIYDVIGEPDTIDGSLTLWPFPWGKEITPLTTRGPGVNLAVVHSYIWQEGYGYPDAPPSKRVAEYRSVIETYDAAVFGDNHKGFLTHWTKPNGKEFYLMNCGTFFARHSDERNYKPRVGLLYDDGCIYPYTLDISKDEWADAPHEVLINDLAMHVAEFLDGLSELGLDSLDFRAAVLRAVDDLNSGPEVRLLINQFLETRQ